MMWEAHHEAFENIWKLNGTDSPDDIPSFLFCYQFGLKQSFSLLISEWQPLRKVNSLSLVLEAFLLRYKRPHRNAAFAFID